MTIVQKNKFNLNTKQTTPNMAYDNGGKNVKNKETYDSLCLTYEENTQIEESKANLFVRHYEVFEKGR